MAKNNTTENVKIPEKLIDQVIGQKKAVEIIKKAAKQRRNVLLIGSPGTGKTLLAQAMAELLPSAELEDILVYKNINDENAPLIKSVKTYPDAKSLEKLGDGQGRLILQKERMKNRMSMGRGSSIIGPTVFLLVMVLLGITIFGFVKGYELVVFAALILGVMVFGAVALLVSGLVRRVGLPGMNDSNEPKLIVDNTGLSHAPFVDGTGSKAGALFGDVRHDPLQCIPTGQNIVLGNGNVFPIEKLVDPYFLGDQEGEVYIGKSFIKILGGLDSEFKLSEVNVVRVYKRKYSGNIIKIKTRAGSIISITPNHPIATMNKEGKIEYVLSEEMKVKDKVIIPEAIALLRKVTNRFVELGSKDQKVVMLEKLAYGSYAFDEIVEIKIEEYKGFVYNLTTETGNYMVDFVLTHNSGGLGTPAHLRVESGAIHKANKGVLFIDEAASLEPKSQQELLTSMQEKKYSITGQSDMSSGALVKTEPAPADFILVAAGNLQDIQHMHPALRSRIRGYGYEVYMESTIEDNAANRQLLVQFIAQEVKKDGKIPPFDQSATEAIIEEARKRAGRKKRLTLILRDLGGLVRAAGDLAVEKNKKYVTKEEVIGAKQLAAPIEAQVVMQELEYRKDYRVFGTHGFAVGKVNGLAVIGSANTFSGIVIPIVSEVTPAGSRSEGKFIPTGKLGKVANEAVKNVSAIIKKHMGRDVANYDMHVQFLQIEGVEGDSASISVAVSIISAMENVPIDQSIAMTGSLSVRGEVLPVGGVTSKVEAAIAAGIRAIILPASNLDDVSLSKETMKKAKLIPVKTLAEVLHYSLKDCKRKEEIIKELKGYEKGKPNEKSS